MTGLCAASLSAGLLWKGRVHAKRYSGYTRQKKLADERRGSALFLLLGRFVSITNFGGERHASFLGSYSNLNSRMFTVRM